MDPSNKFIQGDTPVTIIMITLNEAHQLNSVFENLSGWANEVLILDSYSKDETINICLENNIYVAQRKFTNFGDQWNAAINQLPISNPWTLKLDPDERLSEELKKEISDFIKNNPKESGAILNRRLWFMGKPMPVSQSLTRLWRTGSCKFSNVAVNEHAVVNGSLKELKSCLEHYDSPNLEHWLNKQNQFSTSEAQMHLNNEKLSANPNFFGNPFERRMWLKKYFRKIPFRYFLFFIYNFLILGSFKSGKPGYIWAWSRVLVMKMIEYKMIDFGNNQIISYKHGPGIKDSRVDQYE